MQKLCLKKLNRFKKQQAKKSLEFKDEPIKIADLTDEYFCEMGEKLSKIYVQSIKKHNFQHQQIRFT